MACDLVHQGTVYPATVAAVPFIGELAASKQVEVRYRLGLLELLFLIGRNDRYFTYSSQCALTSGEGLTGHWALVYEVQIAVRQAAIELLAAAPSLGDELFVRQSALAVVADDVGRGAMPTLVDEARRRLPGFGATAFSVIADLMVEREPPPAALDELWLLDPAGIGRIVDRSHVPYSLTDLLIERLQEMFGGRVLVP